jgi:MoaD family protein
VKVRLFHELRTAAGSGEITVAANSVGELIHMLGDKFGETVKNVLFVSRGAVREYAFIYINNILQKPLDMSAPLRNGDVVLVIPPVSGG